MGTPRRRPPALPGQKDRLQPWPERENPSRTAEIVTNLYNAYVGLDCSMLEINPPFKAADDKIVAVGL